MCGALLNEKNAAIEKLLRNKLELERVNSQLVKESNKVEIAIAKIRDDSTKLQKDISNMADRNDQSKQEFKAITTKIADAKELKVQMGDEIRKAEKELAGAEKRREGKGSQLQMVVAQKEANNDKIEGLNVASAKLKAMNYEFRKKIDTAEDLLARTIGKYDDALRILSIHDNELKQLKTETELLKSKRLEASNELAELKHENEDLQKVLEQHKKGADFQKSLRDLHALKKIELEKERDALKHKACSGEKEKNTAMKRLREIKDSREQLLEEKEQMSKEMYALKEHAEVLESRNAVLGNELANFLNADEYAKKQLDRRSRFEILKQKNMEQLKKSYKKLKDSVSPGKQLARPLSTRNYNLASMKLHTKK
eukprot:TRINITY_DN14661_c0_g2_i1.p1 TRINITY_DN14661_c0_g2~~TRINITY_DN14661_c0_g2_i1.p1  ORF type:complete len:369 (+),score=109.43 TRINITY_DN14661_c0_g2_i1:473-1579(+)